MKSNGIEQKAEEVGAAEVAPAHRLLFTRDDGEGLIEQVRAAMFADGLSQEAAAAEIGVSATTLSLYLNGKYGGNHANVEAKLTKWLESRGERQSMQAHVPEPPPYFKSQTSSELMTALLYAQSLGDMALIVGVPGIGKSTTCREYRSRYSAVWIATMAAHTTGVVPVLREIADAVGAAPASGASGLAREITAKVRDRNGLLIIDEAHHLSPGALDAIRALHDAADVAVALVGSVEITSKLEKMPQLYSRLGIRLFRRRVLAADVTALLEAWQITGREERRYIARLAEQPGALRGATKVLRLATALAGGAGEALGIQHIKDAAATLSAQITGGVEHG